MKLCLHEVADPESSKHPWHWTQSLSGLLWPSLFIKITDDCIPRVFWGNTNPLVPMRWFYKLEGLIHTKVNIIWYLVLNSHKSTSSHPHVVMNNSKNLNSLWQQVGVNTHHNTSDINYNAFSDHVKMFQWSKIMIQWCNQFHRAKLVSAMIHCFFTYLLPPIRCIEILLHKVVRWPSPFFNILS